MPIRVQYNSDLKFRRHAAFCRFYRARDSRVRFGVEIALIALSAVVCAIIWHVRPAARLADYAFYFFAVLGIFLAGRILRVLLVLWRVRPLSEAECRREYHFFENGFRFGPTDAAGTMLETRWREVDRAYQMGNVVYLLCKNKTHWAPVDLARVVEGDADALLQLLQRNLPGRRYSRA